MGILLTAPEEVRTHLVLRLVTPTLGSEMDCKDDVESMADTESMESMPGMLKQLQLITRSRKQMLACRMDRLPRAVEQRMRDTDAALEMDRKTAKQRMADMTMEEEMDSKLRPSGK